LEPAVLTCNAVEENTKSIICLTALHLLRTGKRKFLRRKTMKTATNRKVAFGTLAVMGASTLGGLAVTSSVAQASEKGRLNTTLGLGAVTLTVC
jgi:hypothetical protein